MTWAPAAAWLGIAILQAAAPTPTPAPGGAPAPGTTRAAAARTGPTFCAEWIRQTKEGFERLTLFADHTLVWKTSHDGRDDTRRKTISADETNFYCEYFARNEFFRLPSDLRSGLKGGEVVQSRVTLTRPDGSRKSIRFDEFSSFSPDSIALKASLLGLRNLFTERLAPATSFTAEALKPGTLLRRFDGVTFRVVRVLPEKEIVELEGVNDPISLYMSLKDLRTQFAAPE